MRIYKEQLSELEMYWPIGKTWCHRTILPLLRIEKGWCSIPLHSCQLLPLQVTLGANRKMQPFKTNSAFQGAGNQEEMSYLPNKTQRKVCPGTAGHQGAVNPSHTIFTFAHLPFCAEPHNGGQPHESQPGNWDPVLKSHAPVSTHRTSN